jgi:hypothetical protein
MDMSMQTEAVRPQAVQQAFEQEVVAERQREETNTSLLEIRDKVHLSPEGRALLERMGQADA